MQFKYNTKPLNANFFWIFKNCVIFAEQERIKGRCFFIHRLNRETTELKNINIKPIARRVVDDPKPIGFFYVQMQSLILSKY